MKCFVVAVLLASAMAVQMEESTRMEVEASASMPVMTKLGLREVQEQVDKELWEARQAQASADDEDAEIARLLAELEGLDAEKNAAEKEAKQREVEAKEATAAKLKETAIDAKAKRVEEVALTAQTDAENDIEKTKKLREEAAAAMAKAKVAAEEYENAVTAGMTEKTKELEVKSKKASDEAQELARLAGQASEGAKAALANAATVKSQADKAISLEKESQNDLMENGLQWVAGPIFDKMKKLCERDYPTFRKEYRKIRASTTYKSFRWDVKQACAKAREDDLENMSSEEEEAARLAAEEAARRGNPHAPPTHPAKPYPASHVHFNVPKGGKVAKWCTTQYGAVPCTMLKKAKEAGLLGDIKVDDTSKKMLELLELNEVSEL